jgi:hypothetical protein
MLTSGRRCRRGRLGGEMHDGEVEVHAGGRRLGSCSLSPAGARLPPSGAARRSLAEKWSLRPVLGSFLEWRVAAAARPLLSPTAWRGGGAPAFSLNPVLTAVRWKRKPQEGGGRLALPPWPSALSF